MERRPKLVGLSTKKFVSTSYHQNLKTHPVSTSLPTIPLFFLFQSDYLSSTDTTIYGVFMFFEISVIQFKKVLNNLSAMLLKAEAFAEAKKFDSSVLAQARLAPDQFNFTRQVQIACDTAKLGVSRMTGKEAPTHPDEEKTLVELKTRIASTVAYLDTITANDFAEAGSKKITHHRWDGHLTGEDFAIQHMIPNFYFHITTAYAILRHNGVELGKKDFLGVLPFKK